MSPTRDPFTFDTPGNLVNGNWVAEQMHILGFSVDNPIHIRGFHYRLAMRGATRPNGEPYLNNDTDWGWIQEAVKAARWLGCVPFDAFRDQRNATPDIQLQPVPDPAALVIVSDEVITPDTDDLTPQAALDNFYGQQPYRLVLVGEKESLRPALEKAATRYGADLYMPTGDPSDSMIHACARTAAEDERETIVLYHSDSDPSGYNMPLAWARKMQAFQAALYPGIRFQVHQSMLTPDQVRRYGLPSAPLKDSERRAAAWVELMGVEQTEVDALIDDDLLDQIIEEGIAPFYDHGLDVRTAAAQADWQRRAQNAIEERIGNIADAVERIENKRAEIESIIAEVAVDPADLDLPEIPAIPAPKVDKDAQPLALCNTDWSFRDQVDRLIGLKNYDAEEMSR